ncbi:MAG TPA: hypothetical protein VK841_05545 [Polyangiaceae bacterium]|nr:hypothetical protein [Polyangiaceae bacterium]
MDETNPKKELSVPWPPRRDHLRPRLQEILEEFSAIGADLDMLRAEMHDVTPITLGVTKVGRRMTLLAGRLYAANLSDQQAFRSRSWRWLMRSK